MKVVTNNQKDDEVVTNSEKDDEARKIYIYYIFITS